MTEPTLLTSWNDLPDDMLFAIISAALRGGDLLRQEERQIAAAMRLINRQCSSLVCVTVRALQHRGIPIEASRFFLTMEYIQHMKVDSLGQDWTERRTIMPWDRLSQLKHLRSLDINEHRLDEDAATKIVSIAVLTRLSKLKLKLPMPSCQLLHLLRLLPPRMLHLELADSSDTRRFVCATCDFGDLAKWQCTHLETLCLSKMQLSSDQLVCVIRPLKKLRFLRLDTLFLTTDGFCEATKDISGLESLGLYCQNVKMNPRLHNALRSLTKLRSLEIWDIMGPGDSFERAMIATMTRLSRLHLESFDWSNSNIEALVSMPALEELRLDVPRDSLSGMRHLGLRSSTKLTKLILNSGWPAFHPTLLLGQVDAAVLEAVGRTWPRLTSLTLTQIVLDDGALAGLHTCSALTSLVLGRVRCPKGRVVNEADIAALPVMPGLHLDWCHI